MAVLLHKIIIQKWSAKDLINSKILIEKLDLEFSKLYIGLLAEIDSFDKSNLTAKVNPLLKLKNDTEYKRLPTVILPVNVSHSGNFCIIPDYKKGDIVQLVGNLSPISNQLKGQVEIIVEGNHFNLSNCAIIGGYLTNNSINKDGLVIAHTSGNTYINLTDELIDIKALDKVKIHANHIELENADITEIKSDNIHLGNGTHQKTLLGEDTVQMLKDIISAVKAITVTCTAPGSPSGPIINLAQFAVLEAQLDSLLSSKVKNS